MFALTDKAERKYFEVPVIYKGSLLYIVSELCEQDPDADKPLLGMQRYWLGKVPYKRADILASRAWRIPPVSPGVRRTTPPSWQCGATRHGGFPLDREMEDSSKYLLENGFQPWDVPDLSRG